MNRCIDCVNYRVVLFKRYGKYLKAYDSLCMLKKRLTKIDGCCEAWQERTIDQDTCENEYSSLPDAPVFFVMDFDELLKE